MTKTQLLVELLQEAIDLDVVPDIRLVEELIEDLEYKLDLFESHKNG